MSDSLDNHVNSPCDVASLVADRSGDSLIIVVHDSHDFQRAIRIDTGGLRVTRFGCWFRYVHGIPLVGVTSFSIGVECGKFVIDRRERLTNLTLSSKRPSMNLPVVDLVFIAVFMAISIAIGIVLGRKQKSLDDFALGGRNLPWWALLGSIVATETSTATFLGVTGRVAFADGDMRFLQLAIGLVIGRIAMSMILLPLYFRGRIFTGVRSTEPAV